MGCSLSIRSEQDEARGRLAVAIQLFEAAKFLATAATHRSTCASAVGSAAGSRLGAAAASREPVLWDFFVPGPSLAPGSSRLQLRVKLIVVIHAEMAYCVEVKIDAALNSRVLDAGSGVAKLALLAPATCSS